MELCGTLWNFVELCGTLWNFVELCEHGSGMIGNRTLFEALRTVTAAGFLQKL